MPAVAGGKGSGNSNNRHTGDAAPCCNYYFRLEAKNKVGYAMSRKQHTPKAQAWRAKK